MMDINLRNRILNITLRAVPSASKFLLIFFLARFLEPSLLGIYGLLAATIGYSIYFLGFDFYTFTTRELLKINRSEWGTPLKNQIALSAVLYSIFMPVLFLIFFNGLLPWSLAGWFFILLVIEHLNLEIHNILVVISEQLLSSTLIFLRNGTWPIVVTAVMYFDPGSRTLNHVLAGWASAGGLAVFIGIYRIYRLKIGGWHREVNWSWITIGLKSAIPLLIASLAIRGLYTMDRYLIQSLQDLEVLGVYVLFFGISSTLLVLLDAGIFSYSYPGLISAHHKKKPVEFRKILHKLMTQTVILCAAFAVLSVAMLPLLLNLLGNPIYITYQHFFPWILLNSTIYGLCHIPHYALYAQGLDRPIIHSHVAALIIFFIAAWVFSTIKPLLAVPLAVTTALAVVLIWKTWFFFALTPVNYRSIKN